MVDMKKAIAILSSLALLASGCNKIQIGKEPEKDASRHLTVDIKVNCSTETRSVKTGWNVGDVVYVERTLNSFVGDCRRLNISGLTNGKERRFCINALFGTSILIALFSPKNRGEKCCFEPQKFFKKI